MTSTYAPPNPPNILPEPWKDTFAQQQFDLVKSLIENMEEAVMLTDAGKQNFNPAILHVNPAFTALTGYTPDDIVGKTPKILQGPDTEREVLEHLKKQLAERKSFHGRTWNYRKDGTRFMMEWEIVTFHNAREQPGFHMTIQREALV
jgi:PAS domain S-box-containing protein